MRIHMVAIGGSVMHNLALDLAAGGNIVTGSDDEFYEPSRSRLTAMGLLPVEIGWNPERVATELDCVIAGMHAKGDNPEIRRALELGVRVYSFPEFFGERCHDKKRIVVAGSHGKTTTTAMIMHVLKKAGADFDYLIGAALDGFDRNVKLSNAPIVVIEGDEYPSSPLDPRPKIMHYRPNVTIVTGVAWDHMNVFPTWESYVKVFAEYIESLKAGTMLLWYEGDAVLKDLVQQHGKHLTAVSYSTLNTQDNIVRDSKGKQYPLKVFGAHNLQNMSAAMLACREVGISEQVFLHAMHDFTGASMRLQLLFERDGLVVFRDFAHAPSKVTATVQAVKERFPKANVVAFLELHTYSSLNAGFLPQYKGSLDLADHAVIFYSPKTLEIKNMPFISPTDITDAFAHASLEVATARKTVEERLSFFVKAKEPTVILLMSSGRFENADLQVVIQS